jgi:hypothetical protein
LNVVVVALLVDAVVSKNVLKLVVVFLDVETNVSKFVVVDLLVAKFVS